MVSQGRLGQIRTVRQQVEKKFVSRRHFARMVGGFAALHSAFNGAEGEVSSFDFSLLDERMTSNRMFFIRDHSATPAETPKSRILSIEGAVYRKYALPYEELIRRPQTTIAATMECEENPIGGGLVSTAEWGGIKLQELLEEAQPLPGARFVRLHGGDSYVRTIPLSKASHPNSLVVCRMNGDELPTAHGHPLRALIPGWYGMYSVKWLRKIELVSEESRDTVTAIQTKSAFARPLDGAVIVRPRFVVRGAAWAGENLVDRVELSVNGTQSWQQAALLDRPDPYTWVRWQWNWQIPGPGPYELTVRAVDSRGGMQPSERDANRPDSSGQNGYQKVRVTVAWPK
jgi:DMSO/TMAO reductase YedYZ molybdopterin-dependent catalytic subunit